MVSWTCTSTTLSSTCEPWTTTLPTFELFRFTSELINSSRSSINALLVAFCGYLVNREGIKSHPDKVTAIANWPTPRTVKDVKSFLGLAGFYQRFVKNFADTAATIQQTPCSKRLRSGPGKWKHYLMGRKVLAYTDNVVLRYPKTAPNISPRQGLWLAYIGVFDLDIAHTPGVTNRAADAIYRLASPSLCCTVIGSPAYDWKDAYKLDPRTRA